MGTGSPPPPAALDDPAALWLRFLGEARAESTSASQHAVTPRAVLRDDVYGESSLHHHGLLLLPEPPTDDFFVPSEAGDDDGDNDLLPPALVDTERSEVASQQAYIDETRARLP